MNKDFWKKILSKTALVFFLSACALFTILFIYILSGNQPHHGIFVEIIDLLILCLIPTALVMIPYSFYLYGKMSRVIDPHAKPETHTAFKNPDNAPSGSHSAHASAAVAHNNPNSAQASIAATMPSQTLIGVSELIEKSSAFYKANFKKMWPIFLLGGMGSLLVALFAGGIQDTILFLGNTHIYLTIIIIAAILVLSAFFLLSKIALFIAISDVHKGSYVGTAESYKKAARVFWHFLLLVIMMYLAWSGAFLLLIIPGIILYGYLLFSQVVLVDTGKKDFSALIGSWSLMKGHWWGIVLRSIAVSLLFGLMAFVFEIVFLIVIVIVFGILYLIHIPLALAMVILAIMAIAFFLSFITLILPLTLSAFFELYYSLVKVRANEPAETDSIMHRRKTKLIVVIVISAVIFVPGIYFGNKIVQKLNDIQNFIPTALTPYHSSVGSFTVDFLGQPTITADNNTTVQGTPFVLYTYENRVNQNLELTVVYTQVPSSVDLTDTNAALNTGMDSTASSSNSTISSSSFGTYHGLPSIDFSTNSLSGNISTYDRFIIDNHNLYGLSVTYVNSGEKVYSNLAQDFFNSFSLDDLSTSTISASTSVMSIFPIPADVEKQPYVDNPGQFQINLPTGWSFYQDTNQDPKSGIDLLTDFTPPQGQKSDITIAKIDMNSIRNKLSTSTDEQIALRLAQDGVASIDSQFTSEGLVGFQVSDLTKVQYGNDTAYVYRGSAANPSDHADIIDFKLVTIFNGNDGYQIISIWPESEYGWKATPLQDSLATFRIRN